MVWDPLGTIGNALWLGGGQWAGKSTVSRILAHRYGLTAYHHDYHAGRAHNDRRIVECLRAGESTADPDPDELWVWNSPREMAAEAIAYFGIPVLEVDGSRDAEGVADLVAERFGLAR